MVIPPEQLLANVPNKNLFDAKNGCLDMTSP